MPQNTIDIAAPPERVFAVLADPQCYPRWVIGVKEVRAADRGFPATGTKLHHSVGIGPLTLQDHTEVLDANPPWRLELKSKVRPPGTAHVVLLLHPHGEGTHLTMVEDAGDPVTRFVFNPLTNVVFGGRNQKALDRLKELVES